MQDVRVIVHGGAWDIPADSWEAHLRGCRAAHAAAREPLESGAGALEGAVEAVRLMEDDPTFDAGTGSFLTREGRVELDACVMRGEDLAAGAVASVSRLRNPVLVARAILDEGPCVLLVGRGAEKWAHERGFEWIENERLVLERERERYHDYETGARPAENAFGRDTVGAVCRDANGRFAVASSTGGTPYKLPGRVGDTPLPGAGCYAEDGIGAVACTGQGEAAIRFGLAHRVMDRLRRGERAREAAEKTIVEAKARLGARLGVIVLDARGGMGFAHTSPRMAYVADSAS